MGSYSAIMINLLRMACYGPDDAVPESWNRTALYRHFASSSPVDSDARRMWMRCAISEFSGMCPFCVEAFVADREAMRQFCFDTTKKVKLPAFNLPKCKTPSCPNFHGLKPPVYKKSKIRWSGLIDDLTPAMRAGLGLH